MLDWIQVKRIINFLIIFADLAALAALIVIFINKSQTNAILDLKTVPSDAVVSINGQQFTNGVYYFKPGTYTAEISAADLNTTTQTVNLQSDHITKLYNYLSNKDTSSMQYTDRQILSQIDNPEAQNRAQYLKLQNFLPYEYEKFSDDYLTHTWFVIKQNPNKTCEYFCLIIEDYTGENQSLAISELAKLGFDTNRCEIEYHYDANNNPELTGYGSK